MLIFFSLIKSLGPGVYGRLEFGLAFTADGQVLAFIKECVGAKNDFSLKSQLSFGIWRDLANISVDSYGIEAGTVIQNQ